MSRAFIKEDVFEELPQTRLVAPLPDGAVNYVTPRGFKLLQEAVHKMEEKGSSDSNMRQAVDELRYRARSAKVINQSTRPPEEIRFGATVTLEAEDGRHSPVSLVGVDEADPGAGLISVYGVLAQALLGKRTGDVVSVADDDREVTWRVLAISYGAYRGQTGWDQALKLDKLSRVPRLSPSRLAARYSDFFRVIVIPLPMLLLPMSRLSFTGSSKRSAPFSGSPK